MAKGGRRKKLPNQTTNRQEESNRTKGKNKVEAPPTDPPLPPPLPPPKLKYAPPQPAQSYRSLPHSPDDMSGSENNSLVALSTTNPSPSPKNPYSNSYANPEQPQPNNDMDTDEAQDHLAPPKRKRTNASFDTAESPSSFRSLNAALPPNQLGISTGAATPPRSNESQLSKLPLSPNISSAILQQELTTSTPRIRSSPRPPSSNPRKNSPAPLPNPNIHDVDVTGFIGDNPLLGTDPMVINDWKQISGYKALLCPHDASFDENDKISISDLLEQAVTLHTGATGHVVTAPRAAPGFESRKSENRRPWCYLISNLAEETLDIILSDGFIANKHAVFHTIPFNPLPSNYIGRIKNLTLDSTLHQKVVTLIQQTISEDPNTITFMKNFTAAHHDLIPRIVMNHGNVVNWLISSIKAFHIKNDGNEGKAFSHWKWYILTPTHIQEQVERWTKTLAKIVFNAKIFGVGETITHTKCTRCKSSNHTDTECPFTKRSHHVTPLPTRAPTTSTTRGNSRGGRRGNSRGSSRGRN